MDIKPGRYIAPARATRALARAARALLDRVFVPALPHLPHPSIPLLASILHSNRLRYFNTASHICWLSGRHTCALASTLALAGFLVPTHRLFNPLTVLWRGWAGLG